MFAVPGWSISADALKSQTQQKANKVDALIKPDRSSGTDKKKSRKRKRGHGSSNVVEITDENLGDLWRRYIEKESLHQPVSKEDRKGERQSNGGKDTASGEVEDVNGGSFEGFSEEDQSARLVEEEVPPKEEKNRKTEKDTSHNIVQPNGHEVDAKFSPPLLKAHSEVEDGKLKYEQRKAKALKKREQRARLQANGTLPPVRPESVSHRPTKNAPANPTQNAKASKAPDILQEPTATESKKPLELSKATNIIQTPTSSLPPTKLTPLQQRMAAKLTSARFRHLNQTLYTNSSDQAMRLFADSPQNYTSYHAGFRAQVAVWPQNPVDGLIEDIKTRGMISVPSQKKLWRDRKKGKKPKGVDSDASASTSIVQERAKLDPLPRSPNGTCTIADLGCGDATLAGSLSPSSKSLNLKLLSFDLAKGDTPNAHLVTVADISKLAAAGVKDGTVDIAVCCLSLMGTNWVDIVGECLRIVRAGGEVWVAEIKSRFARPGVGKKKKKAGDGIGRKRGDGKDKTAVGEEEDDEAVALEEMEDAKSKEGSDKTDVSAFVEVFRRRGLVLKGEPDMANKMFVRMRFVKSLASRVEKGGGERAAGGRDGDLGRGKMYAKTKFVDDGVEEMDEAKVLKPCVYKTR